MVTEVVFEEVPGVLALHLGKEDDVQLMSFIGISSFVIIKLMINGHRKLGKEDDIQLILFMGISSFVIINGHRRL